MGKCGREKFQGKGFSEIQNKINPPDVDLLRNENIDFVARRAAGISWSSAPFVCFIQR